MLQELSEAWTTSPVLCHAVAATTVHKGMPVGLSLALENYIFHYLLSQWCTVWTMQKTENTAVQ